MCSGAILAASVSSRQFRAHLMTSIACMSYREGPVAVSPPSGGDARSREGRHGLHCVRDRGAAVVEASAGVLAAVPSDTLDEHRVLLHAALRLLAALADDPLCSRAFCHSGQSPGQP